MVIVIREKLDHTKVTKIAIGIKNIPPIVGVPALLRCFLTPSSCMTCSIFNLFSSGTAI